MTIEMQRQNIRNAYRAAGIIQPPTKRDTLQQAIAAIPDTTNLRARLNTEFQALTAKEIPAWVKQAVQELADAENTRSVIPLLHDLATPIDQELTQAIQDLGPLFDAAAATLNDTAHRLPTHDPLGAEEAIAAGAGDILTDARQAVATITTIARIHETPGRRLAQAALVLCPAVTIPAVPSEVRSSGDGPAFNENDIEETRIVRRIHDDANGRVRRRNEVTPAEPLETLVIDVARGKYGPNVKLRLATNRSEVNQSASRLERAATFQLTLNPEHAASLIDQELQYVATENS